CPSSLVPGRRLFRPSRSGASEVRDAASREHRRSEEGSCRCPLWRFPSDVLSSRGRIRAGGSVGAVAAAARPEEPAQADRRSHGVHRDADGARACPGSPPYSPSDSQRTGAIRSSSQHRTRSGAEKKTVDPSAPSLLPTSVVARYEQLRTDVLRGQARPEGLGAVVYHGLLEGM